MVDFCSFQLAEAILVIPREGMTPVRVCTHKSGTPAASIRESDGPLRGIVLESEWLMVTLPRTGDLLVGLPLDGEHGTWQEAWGEQSVDFRLMVDGVWQEPLESWPFGPRRKNPS